MAVFVYKGLTRNQEISPPEFCPISGDWGQVRDTKFGRNVFNEKIHNVAKCRVYSLYRFRVIEGKPSGVGVKISPTQIRVKRYYRGNFSISE